MLKGFLLGVCQVERVLVTIIFFFIIVVLFVVLVDSDDALGLETAASLTFESDLILGQDLVFTDPDNDGKSIGLEKFAGEFIKQMQNLSILFFYSVYENRMNKCHQFCV